MINYNWPKDPLQKLNIEYERMQGPSQNTLKFIGHREVNSSLLTKKKS